MAKKSKALRELEAMEAIEQQVLNASKARLEVIQALKDRMTFGAPVANPKTRRTSVRPKLTSMVQTIETDANGNSD